jgi:ectoine hydroxylase
MALSAAQIAQYADEGFLHLGQLLTDNEVALLRAEALRIGSPARALASANLIDEKTGVIWRSYAMDRDSEAFRVTTRLPRILDRVRDVLGPDIYLWQAHMNHKPAGKGEAWQWHQDYTSWWQDGMPRGGPGDCATVMLMLDDCTPRNGPLKVIPRSHAQGRDEGYWDTEGGKFAVQAVAAEQVAALQQAHGTQEILGPAGSAVMFTGMLVHGSDENLSGAPRCNAYFAYSGDGNRGGGAASRRPHVSPYQLNHHTGTLDHSVPDDALQTLARRRMPAS